MKRYILSGALLVGAFPATLVGELITVNFTAVVTEVVDYDGHLPPEIVPGVPVTGSYTY